MTRARARVRDLFSLFGRLLRNGRVKGRPVRVRASCPRRVVLGLVLLLQLGQARLKVGRHRGGKSPTAHRGIFFWVVSLLMTSSHVILGTASRWTPIFLRFLCAKLLPSALPFAFRRLWTLKSASEKLIECSSSFY